MNIKVMKQIDSFGHSLELKGLFKDVKIAVRVNFLKSRAPALEYELLKIEFFFSFKHTVHLYEVIRI
jgi:hypothetical protein